MKKQDFVEKLEELMELDEGTLSIDSDMNDIEEYDSMALLSIIAFVDRTFKKTLKADQLAEVTTVESLMSLIGQDQFE